MMSFLRVLLLLVALPIASSAQWSSDQKLSTADTSCVLNENMGHCLAVSGDSVYVVWNDASNHFMYHTHSYNGGATWSPNSVIVNVASDFPAIAASGGYVHFVYRKDSISWYVQSTDGGQTWQPPVSLGYYYWWPTVTCSGTKVFVALNSNVPNNSEVWFRRSMDNGATWDPVVQISNAAGRSEDPAIAAANGCVHMAWNDDRTGIMQTWYRRSTDNGVTWGSETQLTQTTASCYFPILCATGANVDLAYGDRQTGNFEIYFKQSTNFGATWGSSKQMTHAGGNNTEAYPVTARSGADLYMVWFLFSGGVYYQHSGDGGASWDAVDTLVSQSSKPGSPFVAVGNSKTHVIWVDHRDGYSAVYYKRNVTKDTTGFFFATVTNTLIDSGMCLDTAIYLYDTGAVALKITFDSIIGSDTSIFRIGAPFTIYPDYWVKIRVRLCADKVQTYADTLFCTVEDTTSHVSRQNKIIIRWRGVAVPQLSLSLPLLDFGTIDSGSSSERSLSISLALDSSHRQPSNSAMVDSVVISGSPDFVVSSLVTPSKIPSGGSASLPIAFHPVTVGQATATLSIFASRVVASHQDTLRVTLNGVGAAVANNQSSVLSSDLIDLLQIYPNPANESPSLFISSRTNLSEVQIKFYNAAGVLLGAQDVGTLSAGEHTITLALPEHSGPLITRIVAGSVPLGELKIASQR